MIEWLKKTAADLANLVEETEKMSPGQRFALYVQVGKYCVLSGSPIYIPLTLGALGLGFFAGYYLGVH